MEKAPKTFSPHLRNKEGRWTVHHFTRRESASVMQKVELADGSIRAHAVTGAALIYTCSETGEERRWGIE